MQKLKVRDQKQKLSYKRNDVLKLILNKNKKTHKVKQKHLNFELKIK